jgi:hypothetical protein
MKMPSTKVIIIGVSTGVVVATSYIVFKHFQRKSARKALDEKVFKQSTLNLKSAFNTSAWRTNAPKISDASARTIAQKIKESIGWFTEDEDKINSAFYGIKSINDLSLIAYQYQQLFETSLYQAIIDAYDGDEVKLARLRNIIASRI